MTLEGKRIVVLGGSSGIGLATAKAAAKEGASVVIASSRRARIDEALATLPAGGEGHVLDLADEAAVQALFAMLGSFDHLVFTAGETLQLGSLASTDVEAARRLLRVCATGARFWRRNTAAAASARAAPSSSLPASRVSGLRLAGRLGASICCAMEGLTRALAVELAPIRVNIVCPGVVKSPLWAEMGGGGSRGALSADGGQIAGRPCRRDRGDRRSLPLSDAPDLRHRPGIGRGWRRSTGVKGGPGDVPRGRYRAARTLLDDLLEREKNWARIRVIG